MRKESTVELIFNSVSHGAGVLMGVFALSFLIIQVDTTNAFYGVLIFGISLIFMYLASTLYHAFPQSMVKVRAILRRFDHSAIYLLITGTYVPFIWILMPNQTGYILMGFLIGASVLGVLMKIVVFHRFKAYHYVMYLLMGWSILAIWSDIYQVIPSDALVFLVIGGLAYTIGFIFFVLKNIPYMHFVWHLFVITGSLMHFFSIINLI